MSTRFIDLPRGREKGKKFATFLIVFLPPASVNERPCVDITPHRATIKKSSARRSCSPQRANRVDIRIQSWDVRAGLEVSNSRVESGKEDVQAVVCRPSPAKFPLGFRLPL